MKKTKNTLFKSVLALLLCLSMLIGSTFAWFTDSVTTKSNIIQTGNLDVEMYWTDDLNSGVWHNVEDAAYNTIFNYDKWEPGYTDVKHIKLVNKGNLAMNYKLTLTPQGRVGKLAEVINVFFADSAVDVQTREDLSKLSCVGLLTDVFNGGQTADGTLLAADQYSPLHPSGEVILTVAMNMITTAGNSYQQQEAGAFTITALATQAAFEQDSFGSDYDTNADFPVEIIAGRGVVDVTPVDGKVPVGGATINGGGVSAFVPAGALMETGAKKLTLTVTPLKNTTSDITAVNNEILIPVDVHIEGIAENNTVPIVVNLGEVLPKYLNMGNYHLFHVENGTNSVMTLVDSAAALTEHNRFTYDPLTGAVSVAMATFSEVALLADTSAVWEGNVAEAFSGGTGTEADPYLIANADQLAYFNECISNENESYAEKHYKLLSDINLGGHEQLFYPIGYHKVGDQTATIALDEAPEAIYEIGQIEPAPEAVATGENSTWYTYGGAFCGIFDGNGNTISNFYQNTWSMKGNYDGHYWNAAMGLFGYVYGGTVKNLTVDRFESDGEYTPTGVIAAYADNATFENIAITNCNPRVYNTGNGGIIGIAGRNNAAVEAITLRNITVDKSNKISALWGSWDVACGGLVGMYRGNADASGNATGDTIRFENCHVAAQIDVYNDVCANYQYYWYRYSGMIIGSIRHNTTDNNGYTIPNMAGISANGCTVRFGDWNKYYYCEFEKNSPASYSEDFQFSRVDKEELIFDQDGKVVGCTHDHTEAEDKRAVYLPFDQLFTGYGWGVKSKGLKELEGVTILDIVEGTTDTSHQKFEIKEDAPEIYRPGQTFVLGDLFKDIAPVNNPISNNSVYVSVSPATENDKVNGTYKANISDWTQGTITLAEDCKGSVKIVITDYYYCNATVLILNEEVAAEKFTANEVASQTAYSQIALGTLFAQKDNTQLIGDVSVSVTDPNGTQTTLTGTADDWVNKTINLTKDGTWTVVITDSDKYCSATTATFTVNKANKFVKKFDKAFLYRVGNKNAVSLGTLFGEAATDIALSEGVYVTVSNKSGSASGIYTSNATWTNGTIQFSSTGVVTVTISAPGANAVTLDLEVIDATNATGATNATATDVVLLNDCGFSTLEVSGGHTLYGNGFTMTCSKDTAALDMGYAFVTLNNGTLDNVQIVCPNYDYAALYKSNLTSSDNRSETTDRTRYYNAKSGVMASGNSQILNSRISGGRASLNVSGGNIVVDNSRIELGAVASILVGSANSLTLRDVTLIQKPTASTYDSNKTLMGFSVLFLCDSDGNATATTLEGSLVQQAWVNEDDKQYVPSAGRDIVSEVMKETAYLHNINGKDSLNLGFAYMPEDTSKAVAEPNNITDNRTDKATIPYEMKDVKISISILSTTVYVYSYKNTNGTAASFTTEVAYVPNKYSDNITVSYSDTADGLTTGKSYSTNGWIYELNVDLDKLSGYALDFSKMTMSINGVTVNDFKVNGNTKPASPVTVTAGGTTYTLTATVNGKEYTASYKVTGTETSKESPSLVASNYEAGLCVASSYGGTWHGAAPALRGVQIKYWSVAEQQYKTINLADVVTFSNQGQLNGTNTTWTYSPANGDFTLTLTGGQVHSGNSVNAMPVAVDTDSNGTADTLYFVAASSKGLVNTGNSARTIPVSYTFQDNNGGDVLTFSYTWSVAENKDAQYNYSDFCNGTLTKLEASSGGGCVTPDTLITLADGSQVRVDSLTGQEKLLVWNMETGKLDSAPIMFVDSEAAVECNVIKLRFSDNTEVKVIYEHGFWDYDLNRYVYLDENAAACIGHTFAKQNGDELVKVTLTDVVIETEVASAWSPVTAGHLCYFVNGMLSMPGGVGGLFNIFDVDAETMTYDYEAVAKDIETYGLFTYEEVNAIAPLSEEMFYAAGGQYLKISIGKGNLTVEELAAMIERYSKYI